MGSTIDDVAAVGERGEEVEARRVEECVTGAVTFAIADASNGPRNGSSWPQVPPRGRRIDEGEIVPDTMRLASMPR